MIVTTEKLNEIYHSLDLSPEALKIQVKWNEALIKCDLFNEILKSLPTDILIVEMLDPRMPVTTFIRVAIITGLKIGFEMAKAEQLEEIVK